jgi:hypothetical protein
MPGPRITKPRCFLLVALAPKSMSAAEANRQFNTFIGDRELPLVLFHDHFIGEAGGMAIFFAESQPERDALAAYQARLPGWEIALRPLIFSYSPSAFDEQIAFTLKAYRGIGWDKLRREIRPSYGDPSHEVEVAAESGSEE